jgi:pSer/pThr/pTyr-binding forkhead associated (FHA) protein
MHLMLAMVKPNKWQGTVIPVAHSPFVIGRGPGCHLRANSSTVSMRHCALTVREDKVFLRDFTGVPGTLVNDRQVQGELEVHDLDRVRAGGLQFTIRLESDSAEPATPALVGVDEDTAASLLLALEAEEEGSDSPPCRTTVESDSAPGEMLGSEVSKPRTRGTRPPQPEVPDTAAAARSLLAQIKKPRDGKRLP